MATLADRERAARACLRAHGIRPRDLPLMLEAEEARLRDWYDEWHHMRADDGVVEPLKPDLQFTADLLDAAAVLPEMRKDAFVLFVAAMHPNTSPELASDVAHHAVAVHATFHGWAADANVALPRIRAYDYTLFPSDAPRLLTFVFDAVTHPLCPVEALTNALHIPAVPGVAAYQPSPLPEEVNTALITAAYRDTLIPVPEDDDGNEIGPPLGILRALPRTQALTDAHVDDLIRLGLDLMAAPGWEDIAGASAAADLLDPSLPCSARLTDEQATRLLLTAAAA